MDRATATANLNRWLAADEALAANSSYTLTFANGTSRSLTRVDISEVRNQIAYYHRVLRTLDAQGGGVRNPGVSTPAWD